MKLILILILTLNRLKRAPHVKSEKADGSIFGNTFHSQTPKQTKTSASVMPTPQRKKRKLKARQTLRDSDKHASYSC